MSGEGTKPPQPPEAARSLANIAAKHSPARRWSAWLNGDPFADLALEAREREYMLLLKGEPRYGDNEGRPPEPATTAGAAQNEPPPPPPDRVIDSF